MSEKKAVLVIGAGDATGGAIAQRFAREGYIALTDVSATRAAAHAPAPDLDEDEEIASFLNRAQQALRSRDFEKAQRLLKAAQNLDPNHPKVRSAVKGAESVIVSELRNAGIIDSRVPRVSKSRCPTARRLAALSLGRRPTTRPTPYLRLATRRLDAARYGRKDRP